MSTILSARLSYQNRAKDCDATPIRILGPILVGKRLTDNGIPIKILSFNPFKCEFSAIKNGLQSISRGHPDIYVTVVNNVLYWKSSNGLHPWSFDN